MASTGGSDVVTNKQLYDELKGLREDLRTQLATKADVLVTDDHETRIRSLERFRYTVPSTSLLAVAVAVAGLLYTLFN